MPKPTATIYLCENAIIDNSYSNTIDFKRPEEQLSYWGALIKYTLTNYMYVRRTTQYIKVDKNLADLESVNYLFYRAEENNKYYFCFVTSKEYISDNASYIYFETDVLQTYMFDYEVKQSYVLQEHCDRWTADKSPIFSRTDEGLEYGSEYTVESAYNVVSSNSDLVYDWYLVVMKNGYNVLDGRGSFPSSVENVANPYVFLLVPGADGVFTCSLHLPSTGAEVGITGVGNIKDFQKHIEDSELANFVHQIIRLPYLPFDFKYSRLQVNTLTDDNVKVTYSALGKSETAGEFNLFLVIDEIKATNKKGYKRLAELGLYEGIESALPTAEQWEEIKNNPYSTPRDKRFESKLLTYPYRYNLLTDWKTQPAIIKNEYIGSDKIKIDFTQGICFNAPARYWVEDYKKDPEGRNTAILQALQEDVPIVTSEYYTYMLQNRNQLQADRVNAFSSIVGGTISNAVSGGIAGGVAGGPIGAVGGALTGALGTTFSGTINYANLIRGQNAKAKDLKNLPDNITSANDTSFSIQDDNKYLSLYRMKICCEFEELLADTFAITGYTVKRVKVPNLKTRVRYNYVKTVGANIVGSFNQDDLNKIKAIFDNGITFWHYSNTNFKPYDYSYENIETSLL